MQTPASPGSTFIRRLTTAAAAVAAGLVGLSVQARAQTTYSQSISGGWHFTKAAQAGSSPVTKFSGASTNCTDNENAPLQGDANCRWQLLHSKYLDNSNANSNSSHEHGQFQINDNDGDSDEGSDGSCTAVGAKFNGADIYDNNASSCTTPESGECSCSGGTTIYMSSGEFHTIHDNPGQNLQSSCHLHGTYMFQVCQDTNGKCCFTASVNGSSLPANQ